ncbi:MAG: hypothetical protein AB8G05_21360 [Oligoflexales bacterium]
MGQMPNIKNQIKEEIATYKRLCEALEIQLEYEPNAETKATCKIYRTLLEVLEFWQNQDRVDVSYLADMLVGNLQLEYAKLIKESNDHEKSS